MACNIIYTQLFNSIIYKKVQVVFNKIGNNDLF